MLSLITVFLRGSVGMIFNERRLWYIYESLVSLALASKRWVIFVLYPKLALNYAPSVLTSQLTSCNSLFWECSRPSFTQEIVICGAQRLITKSQEPAICPWPKSKWILIQLTQSHISYTMYLYNIYIHYSSLGPGFLPKTFYIDFIFHACTAILISSCWYMEQSTNYEVPNTVAPKYCCIFKVFLAVFMALYLSWILVKPHTWFSLHLLIELFGMFVRPGRETLLWCTVILRCNNTIAYPMCELLGLEWQKRLYHAWQALMNLHGAYESSSAVHLSAGSMYF
jgi:hypothetical protein